MIEVVKKFFMDNKNADFFSKKISMRLLIKPAKDIVTGLSNKAINSTFHAREVTIGPGTIGIGLKIYSISLY